MYVKFYLNPNQWLFYCLICRPSWRRDDNLQRESIVLDLRAERRHHEVLLCSSAHGGRSRRGGVRHGSNEGGRRGSAPFLAEADPGDGGDDQGRHRGAPGEAAGDEVQHDASERDRGED